MRTFAAFALIALLVAPVPTAHAASPGFTRTDFMLAGAGGIQLAASLWVPDGPGPFPAMIETNGWNNRHDTGTELEFAEHFAHAGFMVLGFTSRGWGNSGGEIELDGLNEQNDTRAAIDYLAKQDKVFLDGPGDPRVGMVGQSYGGGIQVLTAQGDARIDAIIPHITWSNLLDAIVPQDVAKLGWISLLYATGQTVSRGVPLSGHPGNPDGNGPSEKLSEWYGELLAGNAPTAEMRTEIGQVRSLHPGHLHTPTLFVQGWADTLFMPNQALATLRDLQANNVSARLVLYPGGHGVTYANTEPGFQQLFPIMDDFLNVTLRHQPAKLPPYPVMRWRYDEKDYVGEMQWPPANTTAWTGYFAGTTLSADLGKASGAVQVVNPIVPSTCTDPSNFQDKASFCPYTAPGASQLLTGPAFDAPQEVTGTPTAHIVLSSTQPNDVRLFLTLMDVDAAGKGDPILRQVTPIHLASAAAATAVDVEMQTITRTIAKGHSIGLQLATTEGVYASSRVPGAITVTSSKEAPSYVVVPLVPKDAWGDRVAPTVKLTALHETSHTGRSAAPCGPPSQIVYEAHDNLAVGNVSIVQGTPSLRGDQTWRKPTLASGSITGILDAPITLKVSDLAGHSTTASWTPLPPCKAEPQCPSSTAMPAMVTSMRAATIANCSTTTTKSSPLPVVAVQLVALVAIAMARRTFRK